MTAPASDDSRQVVLSPSRRTDSEAVRCQWAAPLSWLALTVVLGAYVAFAAAGLGSVIGFVVLLLALAVMIPWLNRIGARSSQSFEFAGLLRLSLALKLLATLPRFQSRVDAEVYHRVGATLADNFRRLDFWVDTGRSIPGTGSARYATGLVEVVTFEDEFATFLVFSLAGFVGVVWFVEAFARALPLADLRRYALLVLLWPSLLYWPSSIGKEAMMLFGLGAAARGVALFLTGRRASLIWLAAGLTLVLLVRPHVGLIVVTAAISATILRRPNRQSSGLWRVIVVAGLIVAGSIAADGLERVLDVDGLSPSGLAAALDIAEQRSSQGGSIFESARIDSPVEYPWGFVTVLLRPFPNEAHSTPMLLTALEGAVLGLLLLAATPRMVAVLGHVRSESYVAYAVVFTTVFVYLFSAIGNFGILARQRTTVMPLVLALIALPTAAERVRRRRRART